MSEEHRLDLSKRRKIQDILADLRKAAKTLPPIPVMKAKTSPPSPINQVKSREIDFMGFSEIDGELYCRISASQMWTDEYFAGLDARNPGPRGTPKGEAMRMLIPYEEVKAFFEEIKKRHDESVAVEGLCF